MTIKVDDKDITVWISDTYAEDATRKTVREAYLKREGEIQQLIEQAKRLGIILPTADTTLEPPAQPINTPAQPVRPSTNGHKTIDGKAANARQLDLSRVTIDATVNNLPASMASGISRPGTEYTIKSSDKPSVDLLTSEVAEIGEVIGRGGIPVAIAVRKQGVMGTTTVKMVDTGGDPRLQTRFKTMASESIQGRSSVDFRNGYQVRFAACPLCRGNGSNQGQSCRKCDGAGEIELVNH